MRRLAVAGAAGALLGLVIGLASSSSHRAVTTLSVSKNATLLQAATVAAFARSSVVSENVAQATRVDVGGRLHARAVSGTALVELSYRDRSAVRAVQVVQQAASALTALAPSRFPGVTVAVVDPAHAHGGGRPVGRDTGLGALLGLALGALLLFVSHATKEAAAPAGPEPEPEPVPVPISRPRPDLEPAPVPEPAPDPLADIRAALAAYGPEFGPDQVAEWQAYLEAFGAQTVDGELPPSLRGMVSDVFEPLLARARS